MTKPESSTTDGSIQPQPSLSPSSDFSLVQAYELKIVGDDAWVMISNLSSRVGNLPAIRQNTFPAIARLTKKAILREFVPREPEATYASYRAFVERRDRYDH